MTDPHASGSSAPVYLLFSPWPVIKGTGVNNVILGLRDAMRDRYCAEIVVTGWTRPLTEEKQSWLKMPLPGFSLKQLLGFAFYSIRNTPQLIRMARGAVAINPHYVGTETLLLAVLRRMRLLPKLILSVHGADVPKRSDVTRAEMSLYAWIYASADRVVACSHSLASEVKAISPRANVRAVLNGVSEPPAALDVAPPLQSRYIVSVAAFVRKKGHDVLLQAFRRLLEFGSELTLVLIGGEGPERETIERCIVELGLEQHVRIEVNLPHEEVWNWVRSADCFVLASREEPFGISILEAALVKTPVVATAVGGVPEFLQDHVHGLLVAPDEPEKLAAALLETLREPEAAHGRAASFYDHARTFTWHNAFAQYREVAELP